MSKFVARLLAKRGGLIGFFDASPWNPWLYDKVLPIRTSEAVAEHDREALKAGGVPLTVPFPHMIASSTGALDRFGLSREQYIVVHVFAGQKARSMSGETRRRVTTALAKAFPDLELVLTGGKADRQDAERAAEGLPGRVVAGETTLGETIDLIAGSRGVVSVDTGVAHIAAQLRVPLVVMRSCVGVQWWFSGQYGADAPIRVFEHDSVCARGHDYSGYARCLEATDAGAVASVFHDLSK